MDGMHNVTEGPGQYSTMLLNDSLIYKISYYYRLEVYILAIFHHVRLCQVYP